jgi:hypothetical protein
VIEKVARSDFNVGASVCSGRPAAANTYAIAGRSICVEADETWAAELFDRHFSAWHFKRTSHAPAPSATIQVFDSPPPALPPGLESFELAHGGRCHTDGLTYHLAYDGSLVNVGVGAANAVEVFVGRVASSRSAAALARLVFDAAAAAARRCGLYELHAACVVEPQSGAGVLFAGPSGSGKSTLAAQLAAAGWGYLSDDKLLLYREGDSARVHALRRAFSVTEQTISAGGLGGFGRALNAPAPFEPSKRRFDPAEVFPAGLISDSAPSAVIFPSVADESRSRAERLGQRETMARLIRLCPWAGYDRPAARGHLEALSRLAKGCTAYSLCAGRELLGDAARTAAFVASLL